VRRRKPGELQRTVIAHQFGKLGAFQSQVEHQPLVAEHKTDNGVLDVGRINGPTGAQFHQGHRTVNPGFPAFAVPEILQGIVLHEYQDDSFCLGAELETDRSCSGAVIVNGLALDAQSPLTVLTADPDAGLDDAGEDQDTMEALGKMKAAVTRNRTNITVDAIKTRLADFLLIVFIAKTSVKIMV
jgi:hypothetical protein